MPLEGEANCTRGRGVTEFYALKGFGTRQRLHTRYSDEVASIHVAAIFKPLQTTVRLANGDANGTVLQTYRFTLISLLKILSKKDIFLPSHISFLSM